MALSLPARPRLAEHVLARRHLAAGEEIAVLHDTRTGRLVRLGVREWALVAAADGTRDLEGIAIAAARAGGHARVPMLRAFLEQLHAAGLVVEGSAEPFARSDDEVAPTPPERPLDVLTGFRMRCDGRGSCCRIYPSIVFSPVEALVARARLPHLRDGGDSPDRLFTPERGSGASPALAVAMHDGRCAYLEGERCAIHASGAAQDKPFGCRTYPATFTDDGEAVRVSVAVECACVLASVGSSDGEPLVPSGAHTAADLPPQAFVATLPARVAVRGGEHVDRDELVRWSRAVLARDVGDAATAFDALARDVARRGLARLDEGRPLGDGEVDRARLADHLRALAARASRRASDDAAWRSERDLAARVTRWIARAATRLVDDAGALDAACAPRASATEAFYLRAMVHGHALAGELPIARALADRAARVVLARALPEAAGAEARDEPAMRHPLTLVEAMLRAHGLGAYAHDV